MNNLKLYDELDVKKKVALYQSFYEIGMIVMSNFLLDVVLLVDPKRPHLVMDAFPKQYITDLKKLVNQGKLKSTGRLPRICQINAIRRWLRTQNY